MLRAEKDLQWGRQFDMPALEAHSIYYTSLRLILNMMPSVCCG